jgi:D-aspartate ligase
VADKPHAVVFPIDDVTGLQTARILADRGVRVIGIARNPQDPYSRTRACTRVVAANTDTEELIDALGNLATSLDARAVLFPCTDASVSQISRNRDLLASSFHIALPEHSVVELLVDKVSFYRHAEEHGFLIPKTFRLGSRADAERAGASISFPALLKPPVRTPAWNHGGRPKVYKLESSAELVAVYDEVGDLVETLIVQEWIEGGDSSLYSCNCYYDAHARPLVTFVARKLRQWPPRMGSTSLGEECRNDSVLAETLRLFGSVEFRGLGYVEMKQDARTGNYVIIEPNVGRPTSRSAIAEAGGVDLIYTQYCDAAGLPLPANREQRYTGVKWLYLRWDLQSAFDAFRKGELTLLEWIQSLGGPKTEAVFSFKDPAPFFLDAWRAITRR